MNGGLSLGMRAESLGDAPPAQPAPRAPMVDPGLAAPALDLPAADPLAAPITTPTRQVPDAPATAPDPSATWREDSRLHQLAADIVPLFHL